ncbi:MAG: hypothetical protein GKS06_06085 [Acidobacteria bacterium]|nr:hypothetical protein [Acidobacteriota bacterium]
MSRIDELLTTTSRTFALSIPLLPEPTRAQLGIAYLLFRIADTFEDATAWSNERRIEALGEFEDLLENGTAERALELGTAWADGRPIEHEGYLDLLRETPAVIEAFQELEPEAREIIRRHTLRTARGMARFVDRTVAGQLRLNDLEDLRDYCYVVAGIVGELSTDLFVLGRGALTDIADSLRARAPRFGEALQLVNILKDAAFDAGEGRTYLPAEVDRDEVFALARADLEIAADYTNELQAAAAPRGIVAFCALPVRLAFAALEAVHTHGPGTKVTREQVFAIVDAMNRALDAGAPAVSVPEPVGS